jgi:formylglycine-generating enzyme required for sulfatase activity
MQHIDRLILCPAPEQAETAGTVYLDDLAISSIPGTFRLRTIDKMTLVHVPGGTFEMGSTDFERDQAFTECTQLPDYEVQECRDALAGEAPTVPVTLDGFYLDQTEVTNAQYMLCVENGECDGISGLSDLAAEKPNYPVEGVAWENAAQYCFWVGADLPTEAEWEYAARGPERRIYPWGDSFNGELLNYCDRNCPQQWKENRYDDDFPLAAPVASYPRGASWCGALDMAGNVSEWAWDWYGPYPATQQTNPTGPDTGTFKVVRGGNYTNDRIGVRAANRTHPEPVERSAIVGFRCRMPLSTFPAQPPPTSQP